MRSNRVSRLPGMRDVTGEGHKRLSVAAESFRAYAGGRGYEVIETPLLEEAELFVRKSGGELTGSLYTFLDPGGHRVSLRPEFTSSIIRHLVQDGDSLTLPVRWQYSGPVFRYERGGDRDYRQYTQVGAELIGAGGVEADAEVMSLAWGGLEQMGLRSFQMRVGHLGVLHDLLNGYGLSERAKLFVIGSVQALKSASADVAGLTQQAKDVGLMRAGLSSAVEGGPARKGADSASGFIQGVLTEAMSSPMGRRTTDEIVERLLRRTREADAPERLVGALELVSELVQVEGHSSVTLERARAVVAAHGLKAGALDQLSKLLAAPAVRGMDESRLVLDLGLARGISYYTGVVFELIHPGTGGVTLGGGGRYDGLVRALGGEDVRALGFAYGMERVVDALDQEGSTGSSTPQTTSMTESRDASSRGS